MTHADLHMAVRILLRGTPLTSFRVGVNSTEYHAGRVLVEYSIHITGIDRCFRSAEPKRLLAWVRQAIKVHGIIDEEMPTVLASVGSVTRLRRVK